MKEQPELSVGCRRVINRAKQIARDHNHDFITTEHVLLSVLEEPRPPRSIKIMNSTHDIDRLEFKSFVISNLGKFKGNKKPEIKDIEPSGRVLKMISYASCIAQEMDLAQVDIDHLLLSILVSDSGSGNNLFKLKNIDVDTLYEDIYSRIIPDKKTSKRKTKQSTGGTGEPTPKNQDSDHSESVLEKYATNLTYEAQTGKLDPVIGRDDEVLYMIEILSRRTKNNPVLIGEPGVGKTAIVEMLAQRIVNHNVPLNLLSKQIYSLDLAQLVAGTIYRGQFEERIKEVINYAQDKPDIILFIDELHMLVGAGSTTGSMDASNILKPALARGKLSCIGATTYQEHKEYIEGDGALGRRFQSVYVDEPSVDDTVSILKGIKHKYEKYHNVKYNNSVLNEIVKLCSRYMPDKQFPDKAIDVLDETGSRLKVRRLQTDDIREATDELNDIIRKKNKAVVDNDFDTGLGYRETEYILRERLVDMVEHKNKLRRDPGPPCRVELKHVRSLISDRTGIPVENIQENEADVLRTLNDKIQQRVVGQQQGINSICAAIKRSRAGISDPDKPISSLLFLGPTGVGKTHLARVLGEEMYHEGNFKQYDMSEFSEKHTVSKLIGSPPGYVGSGEGGDLTEYVRFNPYCVLLFDEIEKAHINVLQLFLQILEYGCLTDSDGMEVNFRNTIIVMTSNIGAHKFDKLDTVGFARSNNIEQGVVSELKRAYSPEFINRIDEVIVFSRLTDDQMINVCDLLLKRLKRNVRNNNGCIITYDSNVSKFITTMVEDDTYGARPLKRLIVDHIETRLAELLIDHQQPVKRVYISIKDDQIHLEIVHNSPTSLALP